MRLQGIIAAILLSASTLCTLPGMAQLDANNLSNVKVDALSDDQIKEYYQKAASAGLSQEQLIKLATERGLPAEEVAKMRVRLVSLASTGSQRRDSSANNQQTSSDRNIDEDAMKVPVKKIDRDNTVFGSELFMEGSMVFEPNLRIPSPANYILGPDDKLVVNVFGYSEQTYNLTVNAEGNIYIPNVGPIRVAGISMEEATEKIKGKLASTIYKAISSGRTKVEVSLGNIRSIRVTVIGQATKPGTYTVSSLTTLFNLLYQCGGPNDMGSYRNIELIRGNKPVRKIDLYAFLTQGNRQDNVLLQEQDVVRIPYYSLRTKVEGQVKRAGIFELQPVENFSDLLGYAGGFSDSAFKGSVQVTRLEDKGLTLFSLSENDFASFKPKSGDAFTISKSLSRFLNRVKITGAVYRPGDYELKAGLGLKELIELAGGLRQDAFTDRGIVSRLNADLTPATVSFKVKDIMAGSENIALKMEDVVKIASIFDLKDNPVVSIEGEVRKPGSFTYSDKTTVKDLILLAGGFTEAANPKSVEVSRRIKNTDPLQRDFQQTEIIRVDIGKSLSSAAADIELLPFDAVIVRTEPGYNNPRWVYLEGQVMNGGRYVLEASGERISHLLQRAGGFKGSADSSSITVRRLINSDVPAEERQSIVERMLNIDRDSLEGNAKLRQAYLKNVELLGVNMQKLKENPGGSEDLILEEGDVISVARASNLVRISGEVRNPTLLAYEKNTSAKYYIKASGGFADNARKSGVFVIYPDGRSKPVKRFLWFKSYPTVTARSEVFVPAKAQDNKKGFGTGEWIAISSIIASLATMVIAVMNSK